MPFTLQKHYKSTKIDKEINKLHESITNRDQKKQEKPPSQRNPGMTVEG